MCGKNSRKLKAACLGAGLAVAGWGNGVADAAPYRVTGRVTPEYQLSNAYVIAEFYATNTSSPFYFAYKIAAVVPPLVETPFEFVIADDPVGWGTVWQMVGYTVLGVREGVQTDRVTIGLDAGTAQNVLDEDLTWEEQFDHWLDPTESEVMGWLLSDDVGGLSGWVSVGYNNDNSFGDESVLTQFSPAETAGTAFADIVEIPEPSTVALVLTGSALCVSIRRRRDGPAG